MPKVHAPDGKVINFPEEMPLDDIHTAMEKLYPSPAQPVGSIGPAPDRGIGTRMWDMVRNSAIGYATESTLPKVADFMNLHPSTTVNSPDYQAARTQALNPAELIDPNQPATAGGLGKAAARGGLSAVGGLTTGSNLALMAATKGLGGPLARIASAGFTAQMARTLYEQGGEFKKAWDQKDWPRVAELGGSMIVGGYFTKEGAKHAMKGEAVPGREKSPPTQNPVPPEANEQAPVETPKAAPLADSPAPGSPEYEAVRQRVADLESKKPSPPKAKPVAEVEEEADYLKHPLRQGDNGSEVDRKTFPSRQQQLDRATTSIVEKQSWLRQQRAKGIPEADLTNVKQDLLAHTKKWATLVSPQEFKDGLWHTEEQLRDVYRDTITLHKAHRFVTQGGIPLPKEEFDHAMALTRWNKEGKGEPTIKDPNTGKSFPDYGKFIEPILKDKLSQLRNGYEINYAMRMGRHVQSEFGQQLDDFYTKNRPMTAVPLGTGTAPKGENILSSPPEAGFPKTPVINKAPRPNYSDLTKDNIESVNFPQRSYANKHGKRVFGEGNYVIAQSRSGATNTFNVKETGTAVSKTPTSSEEAKPSQPSPQTYTSPETRGSSEQAQGPEVARAETGFLGRYKTGPVGENAYWGARKVRVVSKEPDGTFTAKLPGGEVKRGLTEKVLSETPDKSQAGILSFRPAQPPVPQKGSSGVVSRLLDWFTSEPMSKEEEDTRGTLRAQGGARQRTIDQLYSEFGKAASEHDADTLQDLIAFNNAGELKPGASFLNPRDAQLAQRLKDIHKEMWDELHQLNPDKFAAEGLPNYLGRLFKGKNGSSIVDRILFTKRPMEGGKGWQQERTWQWMDESIAAGAEPVTTNPIRMQLLSIYQHMKYLTAHRSLNELKDLGLVKYFKLGADVPKDWQKIDDSIFKPRHMGDEGLVESGNYWSHPDTAKIFNRQFQPGLRQYDIYNTLRSIGDFQNQITLGFSGFHATFTSVAGAAASDFALGLERTFNYGKPLAGLRSMAQGMSVLPSVLRTYKLGTMLENEWLAPGSNPNLANLTKLYEVAGGRLGGGLQYDRMAGEGALPIKAMGRLMKGMVKQGGLSIAKAPIEALKLTAEGSARWLMRFYVPRMKMGVFARMANEKYSKMVGEGASLEEINSAMGKILDSVDNRMGQVIYDNRFWPKIGKDLAQLSIRSVGWNFGTIKELGGGVKDLAQMGVRAARGQKAELSHRAAYVIGMTMVTGGMGALMNYAATGQLPQDHLDYFYPRTGNLDSQGNPERISLPTYMKDVFAYQENASATAMHKLHPMWGSLAAMYQNQDYYGEEIYTPGTSKLHQAGQVAKFGVKQFEPISWQSAQQRVRSGTGGAAAVIGSELGFTPAPRYIGQSKAERLAYELSMRHIERGPHSEESTEQRAAYMQFRNKFSQGKIGYKEVSKALEEGKITSAQVDRLYDESKTSSFVRHVKGLYPDEVLNVYQNSSPEEQAQIKDIMYDKADQIDPTINPGLLKSYTKILLGN